MNLLPDDQRKIDEPRPFPLKIAAAVIVVIAVAAIIIVIQMNTRHVPNGYSDPAYANGQGFQKALSQMGTAVQQGTPMNASSNPLVLTAKALGETQSTPTP